MENEYTNQKIEVAELKALILSVLNNAFENGNLDEVVEIDQDYYWSVKYSDFFEVSTLPSELSIGSMREDIFELKKMLKNNYPMSNVHVRKLIGIIMFLSLRMS